MKAKQNLVIDKQTFDTLKTMHTSQAGESNMYDLVYSKKKKALKDDNRLAYYSYQ